MGRSLARTGRTEEARAQLEKAAAVSPGLCEGWYQVALAYRELQMKERHKEAMATFCRCGSSEYFERRERFREVQPSIQETP